MRRYLRPSSGDTREIIRSGTHSDTQPYDGVPKGRMSTAASSTGYADPAGQRYRETHGSQPYPGMGASHRGGDNPDVHGKGSQFHGRPHSPGRVGSPGEQARLSPGSLAGELYRDPVRPSDSHKSQPRATEHRETVGWLNGVNHSGTHPNSGKHYAGHASGRHTNTDSAPGQAHSATGGEFGRPQNRPPSSEGRRAGAKFHDGRGKLDKSEYVGGNKGRGPSAR
jgi:hypothetical protein